MKITQEIRLNNQVIRDEEIHIDIENIDFIKRESNTGEYVTYKAYTKSGNNFEITQDDYRIISRFIEVTELDTAMNNKNNKK